MLERFRRFVRGLSTNWAGTLGVVLTTSAFLLFLFMEAMRLLGLITNAYVGLISYLVLPMLFVVGLILIPIGWRRFRKAAGKPTDELLRERFSEDLVQPKSLLGSRLTGLIALLTLVNLFFLGIGGARMLHFMDEPVFCGTACHSVMHPEWETYQHSAHAHVKCVECHVGEGTDALIDAKLNGLWQMVSVTFNLYERPIPTPVDNLRPARETCEKCHWPEKFYGERVEVLPRHELDEETTQLYSTLVLKVGSGTGQQEETIHWHIASHNEVRFVSVDDEREQMRYVEVRQPSGEFWRYENQTITTEPKAGEEVRVLDCVDCHNRATHVYEDPERAIDERLASGELSRELPWIKARALEALTDHYPSTAAAMTGIRDGISAFYARHYRRATLSHQEAIESAVGVLQSTYRRNIHPRMNVFWGPYPDHSGHDEGGGCFRCHSGDLVDAYGNSIEHDCTLCHSILAFESQEPFAFLRGADPQARERRMQEYLRREFLTGRNDGGPTDKLIRD